MDIPSALQALKQGSALLSNPERRALAAVLRTLAEELSTDSDVAALTTGVALASIEEPPWQLQQPHSEAMPWKLLLCQWWLLGPEDQLRLRGVCSGLHVGELASHFVAQHPGMMYTHLLAGCVDPGDSVDAPMAFRCARAVCAELRFIRNLQLCCAEAEATELAVPWSWSKVEPGPAQVMRAIMDRSMRTRRQSGPFESCCCRATRASCTRHGPSRSRARATALPPSLARSRCTGFSLRCHLGPES